jgi:hypothetical protein
MLLLVRSWSSGVKFTGYQVKCPVIRAVGQTIGEVGVVLVSFPVTGDRGRRIARQSALTNAVILSGTPLARSKFDTVRGAQRSG